MTPAPLPIPNHLLDRSFRLSAAEASGLTASSVRGKRFQRVHHGLYEVRDLSKEASRYLNEQMTALAFKYLPLVRPGEAFSHTTALLLYGAPIRSGLNLHLTAEVPQGPARGKSVHGHRNHTGFEVVSSPAHELPCVPPELALTQCGSTLPFRELVVAIDHLILPRRELRGSAILDPQRLEQHLVATHTRGILRVRAAFEVSRIGAESRYETLTRLELARMGLDTLELQADLHDELGNWIGRYDLADRKKRKIIEYDGEQHRTDDDQYQRDKVKISAAFRAGFDVLQLHKQNFYPNRILSTRRQLCEFLGEQPKQVSPQLAPYLSELYSF